MNETIGYRRQARQRRHSLDRVLLAVYGLADAEGLHCRASTRRISEASGVGFDTTRDCLNHLEDLGHLAIYSEASRRTIILTDHPDAPDAMAVARGTRRYDRWPKEPAREIAC